VHSGASCDWAGPACPSLESPWPVECGDRGGPRASCICVGGVWACARLEIACFDAGPPLVDAGPELDAGRDADATADCPPPGDIHGDGACTTSFLSCPSVENKIPACVGGYEPTTCHCLSRQWSCEVYGIPCPDAGRAADASPDALDAALREASPTPDANASDDALADAQTAD
jgi:hypothetical protein